MCSRSEGRCGKKFQGCSSLEEFKKENNMTRNFRVLIYPAYGLALSFALSAPALGQTAATSLAENNKAIVTENTLAVGATTTIAAPRGLLLTRYYLSSGTLEYTYADGKKETVTRKAGTAIIVASTDKRPGSVKNIGTTALHFITMSVK
jgi:hypothetical protein